MLLGLVAPHLALAAPSEASAAEGPARSFRLVWVRGPGAEGCPDGGAIGKAVAARLGRDVLANDAPASIEGFIERQGATLHAHVYVRDQAGALQGTRDLNSHAVDCAPLSAAVTLAIALAIDPDAALTPHPPATPAAVVPPAPEPPRFPERVIIREPPPPPPPTAPAPAPPTPALRRPSAVTTASVLVAGGLLPKASPGLTLEEDLAVYHALHSALGIVYFPEERTRDGSFGFGLTAATLGACLEP
jgi:hypothetical protein